MRDEALARRFVSGYLRAPGYIEEFERQGFGAITDAALAVRDVDGVLGRWSVDGNGDTSVPFAIPCSPTLQGLELYWQNLDRDATLPVALPLGVSAGLTTKFGV